MASRIFEPLEISRAEYNELFGDSDEEIDDEGSDIDLSEVDDESSSESGNESAREGDEPVEWTNRLHNIHVEDFTSPTGITFELRNEAREIDVFEMLL